MEIFETELRIEPRFERWTAPSRLSEDSGLRYSKAKHMPLNIWKMKKLCFMEGDKQYVEACILGMV